MYFTIRLRPDNGESLTSFLIRTSQVNGYSINRLFNLISKTRLKASSLDVLPHRKFSIRLLSELINISQECLLNMTFTPIYKKFLGDSYKEAVPISNNIANNLVSQNRRICPDCVSENKHYKLVWNIKDLIICPDHKCYLISNCRNCGIKLPYLNPTIDRCHCCDSTFDGFRNSAQLNKHEFESQQNIFKEWSYLIAPNTKLIGKRIDHIGIEENIALKNLWLHSKINNEEIQGAMANRQFITAMKRFIRGTENPEAKQLVRPTINQLFQLLRLSKLSIEKYHIIEVEQQFINSILDTTVEEFKEACLAPWCKNYKSSLCLKKVHKKIYDMSKGIFKQTYICTTCSMKYGYTKQGNEWEEIYGEIPLISKVMEMVNEKHSKAYIAKKIGICARYKLNQILGYLIYHKLIQSDIAKHYNPTPNNKISLEIFQIRFIDIFENITKESKAYIRLLKNSLNIDLVEVHYYLAHHEIIELMLFGVLGYKRGNEIAINYWTEKINKVAEEFIFNDTDITIGKICLAIECAETHITTLNLHTLVKDYKVKQQMLRHSLKEKQIMKELKEYILKELEADRTLYKKDICKHIKINEGYLIINYPNINKWVIKVIEEQKTKRKARDLNTIRECVLRKISEGQPLYITEIAKETKVNLKLFHKKNSIYKNVISSIALGSGN